MERQHLSVLYGLNSAAWSDSHQAAHEPRKDRTPRKKRTMTTVQGRTAHPQEWNLALAGTRHWILQFLREQNTNFPWSI